MLEVLLVEGAAVATADVPVAIPDVPVVGLVVAAVVGELAAVVVPVDEPDDAEAGDA